MAAQIFCTTCNRTARTILPAPPTQQPRIRGAVCADWPALGCKRVSQTRKTQPAATINTLPHSTHKLNLLPTDTVLPYSHGPVWHITSNTSGEKGELGVIGGPTGFKLAEQNVSGPNTHSLNHRCALMPQAVVITAPTTRKGGCQKQRPMRAKNETPVAVESSHS